MKDVQAIYHFGLNVVTELHYRLLTPLTQPTSKQLLASWFYWICLTTNKGKHFSITFYLIRLLLFLVGGMPCVNTMFSVQHLVFSFHTAQRNFHVETKCSLFFNMFVLQVAVNRILFPSLSHFEKEWKNSKTTITTTHKRDAIRYDDMGGFVTNIYLCDYNWILWEFSYACGDNEKYYFNSQLTTV